MRNCVGNSLRAPVICENERVSDVHSLQQIGKYDKWASADGAQHQFFGKCRNISGKTYAGLSVFGKVQDPQVYQS